MASFSLKNAHISTLPSPSNPEFKNVRLALHGLNFARQSTTRMANYSCKKFFPMTKSLATILH